MSSERCVSSFNELIENISKLNLNSETINQINLEIDALCKRLLKYIPQKISRKPYLCLKCNESNPLMFNRKKSECTPCISKGGYAKIKPKLEKGKDHRNPTEKVYSVSRMNYKNDALFNEEIEKCDLVCRNCHAIRTKAQFDKDLISKRKCKNKIVYN